MPGIREISTHKKNQSDASVLGRGVAGQKWGWHDYENGQEICFFGTKKAYEHMKKHRQHKHLDIVVSGTVQGVSFRLTTKAVANQLGVKGIALNRPDGTVYIEAEGDAFALEFFLEWCHEGPENAVVENVSVAAGEMKNYRNFEVIRKSRD